MPADLDKTIKTAFQLHQSGRFDEAAKIYRALIAEHPGHHEAINLLGLVALQTERFVRAIELIATAVKLAPDNARYLSNLGEALRKDGQNTAAIKRLERALEIEPELPGVDAKLGKALLANGEAAKAIPVIRRALDVEPDSVESYNDLATACISLGLTSDAAANWQRALAIDSGHLQARLNLAVAFRELGRVDEAITLYRTSLEEEPELSKNHTNLGIALREKGLIDEAIQSFERAIALQPDDIEALYLHALVYDFKPQSPHFDRLRDASQLPDLNTSQKSLLNFAMARASDQMGQYDQAFEYYRLGNEAKAREAPYDAGAHRDQISSVINTFSTFDIGNRATEAPDGQTQPVFVLGISRSGKSLVEKILACHDDVFPAMEHTGWTNAFNDKLFQKNISEPFPASVQRLSHADVFDIGQAYLKDMQGLSDAASYVVNTSPGNYLYVPLILQAIPTARIIACRRKALDNALFIYFSRYRRRHEYAYKLGDIADYMHDHDRLMSHWASLFGERMLQVDYEQLVNAPQRAAQKIHEFCGLSEVPDIACLGINPSEVDHWRNYADQVGALQKTPEKP